MRTLTGFAVAAVLAVGFSTSARAQGSSCDRACLGDVMTRYLNSLVAHDPKVAPLMHVAPRKALPVGRLTAGAASSVLICG